MAVGRAAGYDNLVNDAFLPAIYSQKVLKYFRRSSVVEAITNTDYAGEIENFGDTVKIIKEPTFTVSAYTRGSTVNAQDLTDTEISLTVDQIEKKVFIYPKKKPILVTKKIDKAVAKSTIFSKKK